MTKGHYELAERYPHLGRNPLPTERIASKEYFEAEREAIFRRVWLCIGRIEEAPEAGTYFVKDIPTLGASVVVTHGRDGKIHAFHNVCTHRGMKLCPEGRHKGRRLNCPYHAWAFNLEGRLVGVPGEEYFYEFDKATRSLTPVAIDTWEGFVFVNLSPAPTESLREFLGEIYDKYGGGYFTGGWVTEVRRYNWDLRFNWKLYLDSSVEGYHAAFVHLFNNTGQVASNNPLPLWLPPEWVRLYRKHRTVGVPANVGSREFAPAEKLAYQYSAVTAYGGKGAQTLPPGVNPDRAPNWAFDILEIFPNNIWFLSGQFWATISLWPIDVDNTRCEIVVYMPAPQTGAERLSLEYGLVSLRDVIREDMNTAVGQQQVAHSGAVRDFILCDQEIAVRHSYEVIDREVKSYRAEFGAAAE